MGLIDKMADKPWFQPDEELRRVLQEIDDENNGDITPQVRRQRQKTAKSVRKRVKLTNVFHVRRTKHLTQAELAEKAGTTRETINMIENGRVEPSVFMALAIAEALETDIKDLFYLKPPEMPREDFGKDYWTLVSKEKKRQGWL